MLNTVDKLRQLERVAESVRDIEAAVKRLAAVRNELTRELRREGVSAIVLAKAMGMTRPRAYQILEEADPEELEALAAYSLLMNERDVLEPDDAHYREWLECVVDVGAAPSVR